MAEFIAEQLLSKVTDALRSQAGLEENINILRKKLNELKSRAADMKEQLNSGEVMYGKKPKREVLLWLENVEKITNEMALIEDEYSLKERNFALLPVEYAKLSNLGNQVQKKFQETVDLEKSGQFSDGLFANILLDSGRIPTTNLVGERNLEKIWNSSIDLGVGILGVYGIEGVGKTTVMSHIHNRLKDTSIYNTVIWVTVSSDSDLKRLQTDIAREIGLELLEDENEMRRAMKLFQALTRRTKFILILDNMQEAFRLEKIGIPKPNIQNGCKLVLVTRSLDLCIDMDCQRKLKVDLLSKDYSFQLFIENLGADVEITAEVEQYARDFAENCDGFPPRIIEMARARKKFAARRKAKLEMNLDSIWKYVDEELKNSTIVRQQNIKMPHQPWFLEDEDDEDESDEDDGTKRKAQELPTVISKPRFGSSPPMTLEDGRGKKRKGKKSSYITSTSQSPGSP